MHTQRRESHEEDSDVSRATLSWKEWVPTTILLLLMIVGKEKIQKEAISKEQEAIMSGLVNTDILIWWGVRRFFLMKEEMLQ